jgi:L-ascorbate metabolism protein UlaG (beta-lactamase superfamily)
MTSRFRFVNLDGSEPHELGQVLKWAVVDRVLGRRHIAKGPTTTPRVAADVAALQTPPAPGEPARLTWIGHASWLVQLDGVSLLIDPIFSESLGPGVRRHVPPALLPEQLPVIDAQLITHNHRDHLDLPSVRRVARPVVAGSGSGALFARHRLDCTELGWWESTRIGAVTIHFVPSQHWSRRGLADTNDMLWGGFVIEGRAARIYHSGDTAYFQGFTEIGRRLGPLDAALLPIGAYAPAWFMSKQHMNPEEATRAFLDLGARTFVAMHWGTFQLTDEPMSEPPERLAAEWQRRGLAPHTCEVPAIGGTVAVAVPAAHDAGAVAVPAAHDAGTLAVPAASDAAAVAVPAARDAGAVAVPAARDAGAVKVSR